MSDDNLVRIGRAYRQAKAKSDALHKQLKEEVIAEYKKGGRTMDIAARVGQSRELVRRIRLGAEKAGLLPVEKEEQ